MDCVRTVDLALRNRRPAYAHQDSLEISARSPATITSAGVRTATAATTDTAIHPLETACAVEDGGG